MNRFTPTTKSCLRWGIEIFAWLLWLGSALALIFTPPLPEILLIVIALLIIGAIALSAATLTALHHRWLGSSGGITVLIGGLAIAFFLQSLNITLLSNIMGFFEISLFFSYFTALIALMLKRDVSLTLLGTLLLLMTWVTALAVVYHRGPANFLLAYLASMESNAWWWWNTVYGAFCCALPVSIAGFVWHLGRLGWREWRMN